VQDKAAYDAALAAEDAAYAAAQAKAEADAASEASVPNAGGMMLMDAESCSITNESESFAVLSIERDTNGWTAITWESCGDHIYGVFSTDELGTNTVWIGRAAMWGEDGTTSWTDTTTMNVDFRFYEVVRMPSDGDFDGDGIPNDWEVDHTLNALDASDATADPDGDGQNNYAEYIADTDPHDSSSYFHVINVLSVGNDVRVFFASASDRYYNLQRSPFIFGPYSNVVQNIPGNGGIQWAKDIGAASLGYWYRVSVFIATNIPPDSDGDGMPDLWTEQYFGHPTALLADLSRTNDNPDGDCFTNLQEYQNATDPTNRDPVATISGNTTVCIGGTLTLTASSVPGATFAWTGPGGISSTNQILTVTNLTTNATGSYCVMATANACTTTNCVSVSVGPTATLTSGSTTNCPGASVTLQAALTGTALWTLTWSDGVITTNNNSSTVRIVSPYHTTTYTITALSDTNCSAGTASGSFTVVVTTNLTTSVTVSNEVLVVYNSNLSDSVSCKDYYINHRPGFSNANVLACSCTTTGVDGFESITTANLTNQIINPIVSFIQSNSTKAIHYVVLMYGMPSRVTDGPITCSPVNSCGLASVQQHISRCMSDAGYTSGFYYEGSTCPFVPMNFLGTTCLVTALNMAALADAEAYIDKVAGMYTGDVIISAEAAGRTNSSYYLDDTRDAIYQGSPQARPFRDVILGQDPNANVTYSSNAVISAGSNVNGYAGWGTHNAVFVAAYPTNSSVVWSGSSNWWIIETFESYNGQRDAAYPYREPPQGDVEEWFAGNAWGGTNYTNTPAGAVSHVEEPGLGGVNGPTYMSLWEAGYLFSECAWASKNTPCFQAVGDPLIKQ
jgi:hypothetical protein